MNAFLRQPLFWAPIFLLAAVACRGADKEEIPLGAPPPSPTTFWNFLGFPQGANQARDARTNRLGNRPEQERKLPLNRIADPENKNQKNPAIATAAEVKAEEDSAAQKIKAIKYLATVGCCCPQTRDDVRFGLLASLSDCEEAVRLEAALAFCKVAGDACNSCGTCTCCDAEVMTKLAEMARGTNPEGCPLEPSARVRTAAANALAACQARLQPTASIAPLTPAPETPATPSPAPPAPKTAQVGPNAGFAQLDEAADRPVSARLASQATAKPEAVPAGQVSPLALIHRPISQLTTNIVNPAGDLPADRAQEELSRAGMAPLGLLHPGFAQLLYCWDAPNYCHAPLYFEEVNLERYGYSTCADNNIQSAISCAHFFGTMTILPYKLGAESACECVYTLGHYRPGSCVPYRIHWPPLSLKGAAAEAGVAAGLIAIP